MSDLDEDRGWADCTEDEYEDLWQDDRRSPPSVIAMILLAPFVASALVIICAIMGFSLLMKGLVRRED